jgi:membrane-associated protease RseP (regulator of RpoE activity)
MDAQVARRSDQRLKELLDKFVCVRAVEMEGVNLSLFQFDYDNTWTAFFLNADRTIYGRYGTRASSGGDVGVDVSIAGFVKALEGALEVHAGYPANKASLAAKHGPPPENDEIREFPIFRSRFAEPPPRGCAHCHHVWEALRSVPRRDKKPLSDDLMWPYPKPDRLGLTLALDERATVQAVAADSAAAKAGFAPGDRITTMEGQPMLSIADVQWVLHHAKAPGDVSAEIERAGAKSRLTLRLAADWRRGEDITWRPSTAPMRPFGWQEAAPDQRAALGVKPGQLCARVRNVRNGSAGQKAGLAVGDAIVEVDGSTTPMDENQWLSYVQQQKVRGELVVLTVIHAGKRGKVSLKAP